MKSDVGFQNRFISITLEGGTDIELNAGSGDIISINGVVGKGKITAVKIIAGDFKGLRSWSEFLRLLTSNFNLGDVLQYSFRPTAYLQGNNLIEKSPIISFHFYKAKDLKAVE